MGDGDLIITGKSGWSMTPPVPHGVLVKVRKLALLPEAVRQSRWAVSVTRLTTLKSLCQGPAVANRFVAYLAGKTLQRVRHGQGRSAHPDTAEQRVYQKLMSEALAERESWLREPAEDRRQPLRDLLSRIRGQQNEYRNIKWGSVRLINDWELLLFEYALHCLLGPPHEAGYWAYQSARHYAERYAPSEGTGLTSASVPLIQDIADFWIQEFGFDPTTLTAPADTQRRKRAKPASRRAGKGLPDGRKKARFTARQGQFLAFIHLYRKLHRQGPAEADLVEFFRVAPPSAHAMIVKLEELGLITREPGVPRSVRISIPEVDIPSLEDVQNPPR